MNMFMNQIPQKLYTLKTVRINIFLFSQKSSRVSKFIKKKRDRSIWDCTNHLLANIRERNKSCGISLHQGNAHLVSPQILWALTEIEYINRSDLTLNNLSSKYYKNFTVITIFNGCSKKRMPGEDIQKMRICKSSRAFF